MTVVISVEMGGFAEEGSEAKKAFQDFETSRRVNGGPEERYQECGTTHFDDRRVVRQIQDLLLHVLLDQSSVVGSRGSVIRRGGWLG